MNLTKLMLLMILIPIVSFASLKSDMSEMAKLDGQARSRMMDEINKKYNYKKIIKEIKTYLKSSDINKQATAAEMSGIVKSKRYKKSIEKLIKNTEDTEIELLDALIFSIGANKYNELSKHICKYISNKRLQRTTLFALTRLNKNSCKKDIKKLLNSKENKDKMLALEVIMKTKNPTYKKDIRKLFSKKELSTVKLSAAYTLLMLKDKKGRNYIKKYIKTLEEDELYSFYKNAKKLFKKRNQLVVDIFVLGLKSNSLKVRLVCAIQLIEYGDIKKISKKDIKEFKNMVTDSDTLMRLQIRFENRYNRYSKKKK